MADIRITFREFNNRELPAICIACGRRARYFVDRRYSVSSYRRELGSRTTRSRQITVDVPVCRKHSEVLDRTQARAMGDRSMILTGVSEDFVDALWDIRDGIAKIQEIAAAPYDDRDDDELPPPRRRRRRRRYDDDDEDMLYAGKSSSALFIIIAVIGVIALLAAICTGLAGLVSGPGKRQGGPPFGPRR
jgi:hypothetical protein